MLPWPVSLPQAPAHEFSIEQVSGLLSAESPLTGERTRTYPDHEATFIFKQLTTAQLQTLRSFYDDGLNSTAPFAASWLTSIGFNHHFCQFNSPPSAVRNGRFWDVSINVRIVAGVPVDGETINYGLE